MKKIIVLLILLIVMLNSCGDNGTGPDKTEQLKDPREMTWTADTLKMPDTAIQLLPQDMLVISPNNIWIAFWVGHGQLWHFGSNGWSVVEDIGGGINCLTRKSDTDLWAGGRIGRSDGNNVAVANYKNGIWTWNEMTIKGEILDMCTDLQGNVWACGRNGLVMKYSNNTWIINTIKVGYLNVHTNSEYLLRSIVPYNNKLRLLGGVYDPDLRRYVNYHFQGEMDNWEMLDSMIVESPASIIKWGDLGLFSSSNKLYSYGLLGIWKYQNNGWQKVYNFDGEIYDIYSVTDDYIIAVSAFNKIFFYNGSIWQSISEIFKNNDPFFVFKKVNVVNKEIYIIGYGTINNKDAVIIWHGK